MKKVLSLLLVLASLFWLSSCSGSREIVKKDGQGNILVSQDFLSGIEGSDLNLPYYYSADSNWLVNRRLNDQVWELEESSSDYVLATAMEDSSFFVFQADVDNADNVTKVIWLAGITKQPRLRILERNNYLTPVAKKETEEVEETIAGVREENVIQFIIRSEKMGPKHDKYYNVEDRYAKDERFVISWDKDAFPDVEYIKQMKDRSDDINEVMVEAGSNEAIVDIRKGKFIKLCWKIGGQETSVKINPYKEKDLILDNLVAVAVGKDYWLKIVIPPVEKKIINEDDASNDPADQEFTNIKKRPANCDSRKKSLSRYSLKQKYPEGYCLVDVPELEQDESYLYDLCVRDGDINPCIKQRDVIIGFNYLREHGSERLYAKYKKRVIHP